MDTIWLRECGDSVAVDTNYRRQIYIAHPEPGMAPPRERAEQYIRAVLASGKYNIKRREG